MNIGDRLFLLRKQHKMTLENVAQYINVKRATVSRYETGSITNIPSDKIELLSRLFNVSPAYLMGWDEEQNEKAYQPKTIEAKIISAGIDKLPIEQRQQVLNILRAMFSNEPDIFRG